MEPGDRRMRSIVAPLPLDVFERVMRVAWLSVDEPPIGALVELLAPHAPRAPRLEARVRAWYRPPFAVRTLGPRMCSPTGVPLPTSPMPWAWADSLVPGVALPVEPVVDFARRCLSRLGLRGARWLSHTELRAWSGLPFETEQVPRLVDRWIRTGAAGRIVRASSPFAAGREPSGWLEADELERFLALPAVPVGPRLFFLVERGADFRTMARALRGWSPGTGVLPTGQPIPDRIANRFRRPSNRPRHVRSSEQLSLPVGLSPARTDDRARFEVALASGDWLEAKRTLAQVSGIGLAWASEVVDQSRAALSAKLPTAAPGPSRARRRLDEAIEELLLERVFYWALLSRARIDEEENVGTMAVGIDEATDQLRLFYAPSFVRGLSLAQCKAVLVHELHHVLFDHVSGPPKREPPYRRRTQRERSEWAWTMACEATANEFVPYPLPGEPITAASLGLPPGESTQLRYERLMKRRTIGPFRRDFAWGPLAPNARGPMDIVENGSSMIWRVQSALDRDLAGVSLDDETRRMLEAVKRERGHGTAPGDRVETLADGDEAAVLDWRAVVRATLRGLGTSLQTKRWPSRRAPERLGEVPGRRRARRRPSVLVAIDTSGSMSYGELRQVGAELERLAAQQVRVGVVQCDVRIVQQGWFGRRDRLQKVYGRGGTSLEPPFREQVLRRYDPDLIVYFTDGCGPAPKRAPVGRHVLWVLTGPRGHVRRPAPWGRVARIVNDPS